MKQWRNAVGIKGAQGMLSAGEDIEEGFLEEATLIWTLIMSLR